MGGASSESKTERERKKKIRKGKGQLLLEGRVLRATSAGP